MSPQDNSVCYRIKNIFEDYIGIIFNFLLAFKYSSFPSNYSFDTCCLCYATVWLSVVIGYLSVAYSRISLSFSIAGLNKPAHWKLLWGTCGCTYLAKLAFKRRHLWISKIQQNSCIFRFNLFLRSCSYTTLYWWYTAIATKETKSLINLYHKVKSHYFLHLFASYIQMKIINTFR